MKGFTLIEIIIYAALISLIIGSILTAVYHVIDSRSAILARISVEEETNFMMKKIKWVMSNVDAINQPAANSTSTILSVNKLNYASNPVMINLSGSDIVISYGGGPSTVLNSGKIKVKNLVFEHSAGSGNPAIKIKLNAEYELQDLKYPKPSSTVETTIYLRKQ